MKTFEITVTDEQSDELTRLAKLGGTNRKNLVEMGINTITEDIQARLAGWGEKAA